MRYIRKVLDENKMLENNFLQSNKMQEFKKTYKLNVSNKNCFPKNIKRNKDGYIILDDIPFIMTKEENKDGHNNTYWLILENGSRILLKEVLYTEIMSELLFKELAKKLDVQSANYDVGILNNKIYLISPSFLRIGEKLVDYYNLSFNNYEVDVKELTDKAKKIKQDLFIRKMLTIDMLSENEDRFPNNFRTIQSKKNIRICPLYDNGILEINNMKLFFKHYPSINGSIKDDDILNYLMQDDEYKKWCFKKIISRQMPNFRNQIYNDKGVYIDDNVYDSFNKTVNDGKALILDNFKNS